MSQSNPHLETLGEIRSMMEKSSRFISLSGLSGVFAGVYALLGAAAAWAYMVKYNISPTDMVRSADVEKVLVFLIVNALIVLAASVITGIFLTTRQARKKGQLIWDKTSRRLLINLILPLAAGGLLCLIFIRDEYYSMVAPTCLIFYGLALINASKYTLNDIRYLGLCEIGLGLLAACFQQYGLVAWALGFWILHIIYGIVMYRKYDQ